MGVIKARHGADWVVRLTGELGVTEAAVLAEGLSQGLQEAASGGRLLLEMGEVESIDVCCLQAVLAAWRSALEGGVELLVGEMSPACQEAVELAALDADRWPPCLKDDKPRAAR